MSLVTACPSCSSRFRVAEAQLLAADGAVRCGACLAVFDALDHLDEDASAADAAGAAPPAEAAPAADLQADGTLAARVQVGEADAVAVDGGGIPSLSDRAAPEDQPTDDLDDLDALDALADLDNRGAGEDADAGADADADADADASGSADADAAVAPQEDVAAAPDPGRDPDPDPDPDAATDAAPLRYGRRADDHSRGPWLGEDRRRGDRRRARRHRPVLQTDETPALGERDKAMLAAAGVHTDGPPRNPRGLWFTAVLVLTGLLAAQGFLWGLGNRAGEEPARSWYATACKVLGCRLPVRRDVASIETRSVVVREHPAIEGALAVDALFINRSEFAQPFPHVELRFSTMEQRLVAGRWFRPEEYLAGELSPDQLMPPGTPVRVSLEIADPGPDAVNYGVSMR